MPLVQFNKDTFSASLLARLAGPEGDNSICHSALPGLSAGVVEFFHEELGPREGIVNFAYQVVGEPVGTPIPPWQRPFVLNVQDPVPELQRQLAEIVRALPNDRRRRVTVVVGQRRAHFPTEKSSLKLKTRTCGNHREEVVCRQGLMDAVVKTLRAAPFSAVQIRSVNGTVVTTPLTGPLLASCDGRLFMLGRCVAFG